MDYQVIADVYQAGFSSHHRKIIELDWFNLVSTRILRYYFCSADEQSVSSYWCTVLGFFPNAGLNACFCWTSRGFCSWSLLRSARTISVLFSSYQSHSPGLVLPSHMLSIWRLYQPLYQTQSDITLAFKLPQHAHLHPARSCGLVYACNQLT